MKSNMKNNKRYLNSLGNGGFFSYAEHRRHQYGMKAKLGQLQISLLIVLFPLLSYLSGLNCFSYSSILICFVYYISITELFFSFLLKYDFFFYAIDIWY